MLNVGFPKRKLNPNPNPSESGNLSDFGFATMLQSNIIWIRDLNCITSLENTLSSHHGYLVCSVCVIFLDAAAQILTNIGRLKSDLANIIEPDFGLLDHLLSLKVLTRREYAKICSKRTAFERNNTLLRLLVSKDQCDKFVTALQQTGQQHIVNIITQNGGQKHRDVITYQCCGISDEQMLK